jgi:putative toxin-antitoxin system antitoxin component (TIGR02293 family)
MIKEKSTTTDHYERLLSILGKTNFKTQIESPFDFIQIADTGIKAVIISNFRTYFEVSKEETANMLNISSPTLYRWIKANKELEKNTTIQLFEVADLFLYGEEVFGSKKNFYKWLKLPNSALGGLEPNSLIDLPGGVAKVRDILGRIEYGVYS